MIENNAKTTPAAPAAKRGKSGAAKSAALPRRGLLTGGLALILAVIALSGTGYLWYRLLVENRELLATDVVDKLNGLREDTKTLQEDLSTAQQTLAETASTQETIKAAIDKIQGDLGRNRTEWLLAEAEQLLVIANHRLQLARDARSALNALRAADGQLNLIANPNLLPVRRELAREITLLESLEKTDVTGLTLKLASLAEGVERLPLALEARMRAPEGADKAAPAPTPAPDAGWRTAAQRMGQDILGLVRIRENLEVQKPLLPPEQQYFLRENLRLMLYGAQLALLQANVTVYQQNLRSALRLLKEYFDVNTQVVAAMSGELEGQLKMKLVTAPPDISASLEALRQVAGRRAAP